MRKFLRQKFWSLGTYLGYLGPISQKPKDENYIFLIVWGPYEGPILVACRVGAKKLIALRNRCVRVLTHMKMKIWPYIQHT